jgi:hypothetical protein
MDLEVHHADYQADTRMEIQGDEYMNNDKTKEIFYTFFTFPLLLLLYYFWKTTMSLFKRDITVFCHLME